jgi:hypothetical protein
MNFRNILAKYYINLRGWKTKRKIVVIESDDWGSIRMPSPKSLNSLLQKGYPVDKHKFTSLDGLESKEDLECLFNLLRNHKDKNGKHPVITACAVVANPDFKKIESSGFKEYHFETIDKTYESYGESELLEFWKDIGIKENLLYPQLHGREHLNPRKWLAVLKEGVQMEMDAFNEKVLLGLSGSASLKNRNYMAAFEHTSEEHKKEIKQIAIEGLTIFEQLFGFKSISFMPSQSKQFEELNETLINQGVLFNQGGQYFISDGAGAFKKVNKFWGDIDEYGMKYWRRNCLFEPYKSKSNPVNSCLEEIEIAFKCGKPAVISSHRINYTSRIDENHRNQSLVLLDDLLSKIIKNNPDVEFMNSEQLAKTIR